MIEYGRLGGWRHDLEDYKFLRESTLPPVTDKLRAMRTWDAPEKVDPRPWLQIEDQRNMGSCQGHALSSCVEVAYNFESKEIIQLSRMFAYIMSQRQDGIRGDSGSTISGGAKCAKEVGLCLESTFPYPGSYTTNVPQAAIEEAKNYRIKNAVQMQSYDDIFEFLASGVGGIDIGIMWTIGDVEVVENYRGGGGGGHALGLVGYTERKDSSGKNYIIMVNSWGKQWGNNGTCEVSPRAIEQMLNSSFCECIGLSDMENIEPRRIEYKFL